MKKTIKGYGVTTSFDLPAEMLAQVRVTSRQRGMTPSTFYRFAIVAMLKHLNKGVDEENPKTERRWYDRVKDSVEYVIRNLGTLMFVWDKFRGM